MTKIQSFISELQHRTMRQMRAKLRIWGVDVNVQLDKINENGLDVVVASESVPDPLVLHLLCKCPIIEKVIAACSRVVDHVHETPGLVYSLKKREIEVQRQHLRHGGPPPTTPSEWHNRFPSRTSCNCS